MGSYNNTCVLSVYTPVKATISVQRIERDCMSVCVCVCVCFLERWPRRYAAICFKHGKIL